MQLSLKYILCFFDKMVNLCKKEMERSWERLETHTGKNVTLNLRDELKPFAVKQK